MYDFKGTLVTDNPIIREAPAERPLVQSNCKCVEKVRKYINFPVDAFFLGLCKRYRGKKVTILFF